MENKEYRPITGNENYGVSIDGDVVSFETGKSLPQYDRSGYKHVSFHRSDKGKYRVHRLVASEWVDNPDPEVNTIINHKDGNPSNNHASNLEWTTYSGNNYHAVNTGLRPDAVDCAVRDFYTKEITIFPSIAQACEYMGLKKDKPLSMLIPSKFGRLLKDRYEFTLLKKPFTFFYLNRDKLIKPSRYLVIVTHPDGTKEEITSQKGVLKRFQVYDSHKRSIPDLVAHARKKHPSLDIKVRDAYEENKRFLIRETKLSHRQDVRAVKDKQTILFRSITKCAEHFGVDRSVILKRLDNGQTFEGWNFNKCPS